MKLIFVSHWSEDLEAAETITKGLSDCLPNICEFFLAEHHHKPGTDWVQSIKENLRRADAFVVLCSRDSLARDWVRLEIGAAWALGKPIYPVRLEEEPKYLPEPISNLHAYDAQRYKGSALQSEAVLSFLKNLADDLAKPFRAEDCSELVNRINATLKDVKDDFKLIREDKPPQKLTFTGSETNELTRTFLELTNHDNKMKLGDFWELLWQKYEIVRSMWDPQKNWQDFETQWSDLDVKLRQLFPEIRFTRQIDPELSRVVPELQTHLGKLVELIVRS